MTVLLGPHTTRQGDPQAWLGRCGNQRAGTRGVGAGHPRRTATLHMLHGRCLSFLSQPLWRGAGGDGRFLTLS